MLSTQVNYNGEFRAHLEAIAVSRSDVLILNRCLKDDQMYTRCDTKAVYKYPQILQVCVSFNAIHISPLIHFQKI